MADAPIPMPGKCATCNDTGQVWTPEQDGSGMWDMACPNCDTPYPLPEGAPHPMAPEFDEWEATSRHTASRMNRGTDQ